jgi:hypothetical protein
MLSIWNRAAVMMAVVMLVLVGCGKDKPAEGGDDTWTKKAGDLQMKLADVKKEQEALNTQLYTMPAAASTDSAVSVERASIEGMLNEDATKVGQIETMLSDDATRRDKLKADGDNDAFKAAWTATEAKYTEAMTALDAMKKRNSELKTRIANLDKIAAGATGTDSSNTTLPSMNGIDSGRTGKADTGTTVR